MCFDLINSEKYVRVHQFDEVSKIFKGVLLDLIENFEQNTMRVTREEVSLDELKRKILFAPLLSVVMICLATFLAYQTRLGKYDVILLLFFKDAMPYDFVIVYHTMIFTFVYFVYLISASILLDVGYHKIVITEVIKNNIIERIKKFYIYHLLTPVAVIAILKWILPVK